MSKYDSSVLNIINTVDKPNRFSLSAPSKISKKTKSAFSIPAGPYFSCPGATEACKGCYARKGRHFFTNVQTAFVKNWKLLKWFEQKNNVIGAAKAISKEIPRNRYIFRINESGDFHSQFVIDVWTKVTKLRRDIKFWAYTRSFNFDYSKLVRQPNMQIWASTDDFNLSAAKRFVKRYKNSNIKHAFGPWGHSRPLPSNSFVCPATSKAIETEGACEKCMLCINNKVKKHVVFLAH